ncbi:hypothetical protein PUN28_011365 [Cardiocondyla obscurior]|uniref:Ribosomal protein S18 n=1 Tax=Cardiocondyla obscurior TaxID=286306 RepID=A0AAW2FDQ6_9HYME
MYRNRAANFFPKNKKKNIKKKRNALF